MTNPPRPPTLPPPRPRARVGGPELEVLSVKLRTLTPILGGAHHTRESDEVDIIRVPSIKGGLRMWWRALFGGQFATPWDLYQAEVELWGGLLPKGGDGVETSDQGKRAAVEIAVKVHNDLAVPTDTQDIAMGAPDAYALWPARGERKSGTPPAPRRGPGLEFTVTLRYPANQRSVVQSALRAWVLFGGYGGRTRRGLGSLTVIEGPNGPGAWLPREAKKESVEQVFDYSPFTASPRAHFNDLPRLSQSELVVGNPTRDPLSAWYTALGWLQDFRQGAAKSVVATQQSPTARDFNRGRGRTGAGRSFWPEPDKVRHRAGKGPWAHDPKRLNDIPVWPRAGFGLPILGKFQTMDASGSRYSAPEPRDYQIIWKGPNDKEHDRLGSPLIVKVMPLADGSFVPMALWLHRAFPMNAKVRLSKDNHSDADFDVLSAPGDPVLYAPLDTPAVRSAKPGHRLRRAFMDWLVSSRSARRIV